MTIETSSQGARRSTSRERTSGQGSPPRPQPSGGIATEPMARRRRMPARSSRPPAMSSMRLRSRQWRLVGKLTTKGAGVEDEAAPGPNRAPAAGVPIGLVVGREAMPELEGEPPAHDADAVDGIDEGLAAGLEEVASSETDHGRCSWRGKMEEDRRGPAHGRPAPDASVRKVAETRVAASRALSARSMPCIQSRRAAPARIRTERRGSTATSSPGRPPAA